MSARLRRATIAGTTVALGVALTTPTAAFAGTAHRVIVEPAPLWTGHSQALAHTSANAPVQLRAVLALRDAAGAEQTAAQVSDPASPRYGKYLTPAQWRAAYAPSAAELRRVTSFLTSNGFKVGAIPANNRFVSFTGTAGQAEAAFGTTLREFSKSGRRVTAPASAVSVPASLAGVVVGVSGLDTSAISLPARIDPHSDRAAATTPAPATADARTAGPRDTLPPPGPVFKNATPCSAFYGEKAARSVPQVLPHPLTYAPCGYTPAQIRGAYGLDQALKQGYDGRGATVAVVDAYASPTIVKDATTYAKRNDRSHPLRGYQFAQSTPATYTDTVACGAPGWYGEETLDVEAVHATAPQANILYVGATSCQNSDLNAAVNSVVDNGLAQIVTNSYGSAGEPKTVAAVQAEHDTFLQAAAQGISMLFSSGDSGDEKVATGTRQVDYEASDPYVTAVGGTALAVGPNNSYAFEQGWGTGKSTLSKDGKSWTPLPSAYVYGGGGGTSRLFAQPSYQKGVVPVSISRYFGGKPGRAVPDVAMVADPSTGFLVGQSQTDPDGKVRYSEYRIGGTSLSSPLFAGATAIADQVGGASLGFLNPKLYKLSGSSALHDIDHSRKVTDGVVRVDYVNGVDATAGTRTSLRTLGQTGSIYTRPGYDDVAGVGTPNGVSFLLAMAQHRR